MKYAIAVLLALVCLSASAQPRPPSLPLWAKVDITNGTASIGINNAYEADTIAVLLDRDDCRSPALIAVDPHEAQLAILVPSVENTNARCLLRAGDRLTMLHYRQGRYLGSIGPYVVPVYSWLPMVRQ